MFAFIVEEALTELWNIISFYSQAVEFSQEWAFFVTWSQFPKFLKLAASWRIITATLRKLILYKESRDFQTPNPVLTQKQVAGTTWMC